MAEIRQCTNAEYHADPAISHSQVEVFRKSPRLFNARFIERSIVREESDSLRVGTYVHSLVLEPESLGQYVVAPKCDRRTTTGKATWASFVEGATGKTVVDAEEWALANAIAESVLANGLARTLLSGTILDGSTKEESIFWTHPTEFLELRARLDCVKPNMIVDLKTARDSSPEGFAKAAANWGYARQAAWYREAYRQMHGDDADFVFIVVEKEPPYCIGIYDLDPAWLERAHQQNEAAIRDIARRLDTEDWSSPQENRITTLAPPAWERYEGQYQEMDE